MGLSGLEPLPSALSGPATVPTRAALPFLSLTSWIVPVGVPHSPVVKQNDKHGPQRCVAAASGDVSAPGLSAREANLDRLGSAFLRCAGKSGRRSRQHAAVRVPTDDKAADDLFCNPARGPPDQHAALAAKRTLEACTPSRWPRSRRWSIWTPAHWRRRGCSPGGGYRP